VLPDYWRRQLRREDTSASASRGSRCHCVAEYRRGGRHVRGLRPVLWRARAHM